MFAPYFPNFWQSSPGGGVKRPQKINE